MASVSLEEWRAHHGSALNSPIENPFANCSSSQRLDHQTDRIAMHIAEDFGFELVQILRLDASGRFSRVLEAIHDRQRSEFPPHFLMVDLNLGLV